MKKMLSLIILALLLFTITGCKKKSTIYNSFVRDVPAWEIEPKKPAKGKTGARIDRKYPNWVIIGVDKKTNVPGDENAYAYKTIKCARKIKDANWCTVSFLAMTYLLDGEKLNITFEKGNRNIKEAYINKSSLVSLGETYVKSYKLSCKDLCSKEFIKIKFQIVGGVKSGIQSQVWISLQHANCTKESETNKANKLVDKEGNPL